MDEKYFEDLELMAQILPQVSAQVRSAMGNIQLSLNLLQEKNLDSADEDFIRNLSFLNQSYYRLLRLSKNLTAAELLSDECDFTTEEVELVALITALIDPVESLSAEKGLEFSFTCDKPYILTAVNVEQLRFLLYQLLSNALKFTPAGGKVHLELKATDTAVILSVSDTGCGISAGDMETIFDRFRHAEPHPAPCGLGLGLPLCRAIARRHGGTLVLDSTVGRGTTATVSLRRVKPKSITLSDLHTPYESRGSLFFAPDGYSHALTYLADALPFRVYDPHNLE